MFADLRAWDARGDRLIRAADGVRRVGLHIERVDMTRPAPLKQKDDRLGPRTRPRGRRRSLEQPREAQSQQSQTADLEHLPATLAPRANDLGMGWREHPTTASAW